MSKVGKVFLVGAGPGDMGLITVRGKELLTQAEVVLYDRLVDPRLLEVVPQGAERVNVGKGPGDETISQEKINAMLVQKAREGKAVVRLKGGDPFLFGRGGEEAEVLARAGVPFEVVPGVTSALAVPAYAGIPVTQRGVASSVAVVTGSEDPGKARGRVDWARLATAVDTLVVLMGVANLRSIVAALTAAGRPPTTPVALVRWGTTPEQRVVQGTLESIVDHPEVEAMTAPVVMVVGEVVRLRETLQWYERRPLFGKRVLVTRSQQRAGELSQLLTAEGAMTLEVPAIELTSTGDWAFLDRAIGQLGSYRWAVFTSATGVEIFFDRLAHLGKDGRWFGAAKVCAIGPGTAAGLRKRGILADYVPEEFDSEGLLKGLTARLSAGDRVLLPRALEGRDVLPKGLRALGALVDEVPLYQTRAPQGGSQDARTVLGKGVDIVTFTSSSTVSNLMKMLDGDAALLKRAVIASIGPATSETVRRCGLQVDVEAAEHTIPGLVRAVVGYVEREPGR